MLKNQCFIYTAETKDSLLSGIVGIKCLAINQMEDKLAMGPNGNSKPILLDVNK